MEESQVITFNDLPQAVWKITQELHDLREMVATLQPPKPVRRHITIDEACAILHKAKSTVYTLSRLGQIPSIRQGRKVYFTEEELLKYIDSGRVVTAAEIQAEAEKTLYKGTRRAH